MSLDILIDWLIYLFIYLFVDYSGSRTNYLSLINYQPKDWPKNEASLFLSAWPFNIETEFRCQVTQLRQILKSHRKLSLGRKSSSRDKKGATFWLLFSFHSPFLRVDVSIPCFECFLKFIFSNRDSAWFSSTVRGLSPFPLSSFNFDFTFENKKKSRGTKGRLDRQKLVPNLIESQWIALNYS